MLNLYKRTGPIYTANIEENTGHEILAEYLNKLLHTIININVGPEDGSVSKYYANIRGSQ